LKAGGEARIPSFQYQGRISDLRKFYYIFSRRSGLEFPKTLNNLGLRALTSNRPVPPLLLIDANDFTGDPRLPVSRMQPFSAIN
jgi:hypothetical protein